jgi:hypothetical protein
MALFSGNSGTAGRSLHVGAPHGTAELVFTGVATAKTTATAEGPRPMQTDLREGVQPREHWRIHKVEIGGKSLAKLWIAEKLVFRITSGRE